MTPRLLALIAATALGALGCSGEKPAPPPAAAPETTAPAGGLRPLTSRDGAARFESPEASSPEMLPPGHPPLSGAADGKAVTGTVTIAPYL